MYYYNFDPTDFNLSMIAEQLEYAGVTRLHSLHQLPQMTKRDLYMPLAHGTEDSKVEFHSSNSLRSITRHSADSFAALHKRNGMPNTPTYMLVCWSGSHPTYNLARSVGGVFSTELDIPVLAPSAMNLMYTKLYSREGNVLFSHKEMAVRFDDELTIYPEGYTSFKDNGIDGSELQLPEVFIINMRGPPTPYYDVVPE